jgi:hypothetical protein
LSLSDNIFQPNPEVVQYDKQTRYPFVLLKQIMEDEAKTRRLIASLKPLNGRIGKVHYFDKKERPEGGNPLTVPERSS